jgi:hypothetical protein
MLCAKALLKLFMPTDSNSNPFLDTLIALRDRYLALATSSAPQAGHAREQLNHINALLVDQAISIDSAFAPAAQLPLAPLPLPALNNSPAADLSDQPAPAAEVVRPLPTTPGKSQRETVLSLLPSFAGLTKTEAVAQVMTNYAGQALSLDQIIEQLHGELDESALRQERKRMRTILWRGVDSKRWQKVKGKDSHYTLPAKLLPASNGKASGKPKPTATPQTARKTKAALTKTAKTRKATTAKPAIAGSLMGAVEQVLQDNQGTPMRAEAIATALYGELSPARLAEVKKEVSDRLAKGAKVKRWQRVPKQLGVYVFP